MKLSTLFPVLLAIASVASLAACMGETASSLNGGPSPGTFEAATEPSPEPEEAGATSPDAGPVADSAAPDARPEIAKPKNAFEGAASYAGVLGPATRKAGHSFNNNTPITNPAGRACLDCHGASGGAPRFSAAGTVYAGGAPAGSVEVRAVGADGKAYSAYTNADGNFFFRAAAAPIAFPAMMGARNATGAELMLDSAAQGNCNQCHSIAGGAGRMFVMP